MRDNFWLRFRLQKSGNPSCENMVQTLVYLFNLKEQDISMCLYEYKQYVKEKGQEIKSSILPKDLEKLSSKKIAFFGDSITSDYLGYANILCNAEIFAKADNYAVSGYTVSNMSRDVRNQLSNKYDFVSVFIGTNDSYINNDYFMISDSEFARSLKYTLDEIKKAGAKIMLIKLPAHLELENRVKHIEKYNKVITKLGKKYKATIIDLRKLNPTFIEDNIHLDKETQLRLCNEFVNRLVKIK